MGTVTAISSARTKSNEHPRLPARVRIRELDWAFLWFTGCKVYIERFGTAVKVEHNEDGPLYEVWVERPDKSTFMWYYTPEDF